MSRKQWGHGYWNGFEAGKENTQDGLEMVKTELRPFESCWHWKFKHTWWYNIRQPLKIEISKGAGIGAITWRGFIWFFDV